jgi:hypothetical protein
MPPPGLLLAGRYRLESTDRHGQWAASGYQPRAEPTMESPRSMQDGPKTATQAPTDKREVAATP